MLMLEFFYSQRLATLIILRSSRLTSASDLDLVAHIIVPALAKVTS